MYFQIRVYARPHEFSDAVVALSVGVSVIGYYEEFLKFSIHYLNKVRERGGKRGITASSPFK